jgi:hypothetical protein
MRACSKSGISRPPAVSLHTVLRYTPMQVHSHAPVKLPNLFLSRLPPPPADCWRFKPPPNFQFCDRRPASGGSPSACKRADEMLSPPPSPYCNTVTRTFGCHAVFAYRPWVPRTTGGLYIHRGQSGISNALVSLLHALIPFTNRLPGLTIAASCVSARCAFVSSCQAASRSIGPPSSRRPSGGSR